MCVGIRDGDPGETLRMARIALQAAFDAAAAQQEDGSDEPSETSESWPDEDYGPGFHPAIGFFSPPLSEPTGDGPIPEAPQEDMEETQLYPPAGANAARSIPEGPQGDTAETQLYPPAGADATGLATALSETGDNSWPRSPPNTRAEMPASG